MLDNLKMPDDYQGKRTFLDNRHPYYKDYIDAWNFYGSSYNGGPKYLTEGNLTKHPKENESDFTIRLKRSTRMNFSRQVIDLLNSYMFKSQPSRKEEAPEELKRFWINADGKGSSIDLVMRNLSQNMAKYGIVYIMVDKPDKLAISKADELETGMPYIYSIDPQNVLDVIFDDVTGHIIEILIQENVRNVKDLSADRKNDNFEVQYRLWTSSGWTLHVIDDKKEPKQIAEGSHSLGRVPIVKLARNSVCPYVAPSVIEDVAFLDRRVYNLVSLLDQIIFDQTFSTLMIPVKGQADDFLKKWGVIVGTKSVIPYDGESSTAPSYLSPDASQASVIATGITDSINQIYRLTNLFGEVGTEKGSVVQAQSGVSQAYDFEKLNAALAVEADCIEAADLEVARLVMLWMDNKEKIENDLVDYPDDFDVKTLMQEVTEIQQLQLLNVSDTFNKLLKKNIVAKSMPKLDDATTTKINQEIEAQPDETDVVARAKEMNDALAGDDDAPKKDSKKKESK